MVKTYDFSKKIEIKFLEKKKLKTQKIK